MTLRCRSKGLLLATQKTAQAQRVYSSISGAFEGQSRASRKRGNSVLASPHSIPTLKKTGEEKRAFSPQKKEEKQVKQTPTSAGKNRSRGDQK